MNMVQKSAMVHNNPPLRQGMIAVLYEKDFRGVRPALLQVKKEYREIITTAFCSPLAGDLSLEVIVVRGADDRIVSLERDLVAKRGVRSVRLTLIPS